MFGRATITLGIGPHSSFLKKFCRNSRRGSRGKYLGHLGAMPTQAEASTEFGTIETPKASSGVGNEEGCPFRSPLGSLGSIVISSPSGGRGRAPA